MSITDAALENLSIIRSLMERAHLYRTVSAPAALVGGIIALVAAAWPVWHAADHNGAAAMSDTAYLTLWLAILGVASVVNTVLLAREAGQRGQPFVSPRLRMALRAIVPPLLVGGVVGIGLIVCLHNLALAAFLWILCYGLALLATAGFSPRSLIRLGWAFVIAGLALFLVWAVYRDIDLLPSDQGVASLAMGLTFGLMHVIYALTVFLSPKPQPVEVGLE